MIDDLLASLARSTVAFSVAALILFALRRPLRRAFGAGVAYVAWLAVPLCTVATLLPLPNHPAWTAPVVAVGRAAVAVAPMHAVAPSPTASWTILVVWAIGFVAAAALQVHLQRRFVRSLGRLSIAGDVAVSESLAAGPALVGLWRPLIALPADFDERYTPHERELVIAHERAHARHHDTIVNAFCAVLQCIWWFDPIAYLAARAVRADQEMARDADVLRAHPRARQTYAGAMLKAQLASTYSPIACPWRPRHPLKERMMQLDRTTHAALSRIGTFVVASIMFGGAYAAWAAQADDVDPGRTGNARWMTARPAVAMTLEAGPQPAQYLIRAVVTDLVTGTVLSKPRLLTRAGERASIEVGAEKNDRGVGLRVVVIVHPSGQDAEYTSEVLRDGRVESSQSGSITRSGPAPAIAAAQTEPAGPDVLELSFSSSDARELACAATAFAASGDSGAAAALRAPVDGKIHTASYSTPTPAAGAEVLVEALAKCQLGVDSNLAWSTRPGRVGDR